MSLAFAVVPGMFAAPKVGSSTFVTGMSTETRSSQTGSVVMAVDAFQRKFQKMGKISVDYTRPKKLSAFQRSNGGAALLDYPQFPSFAGHYSISNCGAPSGASNILMKYDEYCAKGMMQTYKRSGVPYGEFTSKCTEATTPYGAAEGKRVFTRQTAFRQAQKPINVRLAERYAARQACFIMANNCDREEKQFASMPMSCATYLQGKMEATGACFRTVLPSSTEEDYMASGVRAQLIQKKMNGVFPLGYCMDGHAKGQAEDRRVAVLASEYRAQQQSPSTVTSNAYNARKMALKLHAHNCSHEESQFSSYPSVSAAMLRY